MTWKRAFIVFLAVTVAAFLASVLSESLNVSVYARGGVMYFAMAMAAWVVARDYIKTNVVLGQSFVAWFFSTVATAVLVTLLMWRFWPR